MSLILKNLVKILAIAGLATYNIEVINYARKILHGFVKFKQAIIITTIFNSVMFIACHYLKVPLPLKYILMYVTIFTEFKIFSTSNNIHLTFGTNVFVLHILLIEYFVVTVFSLILNVPIYHVLNENEFLYFTSVAVMFLVCFLFLKSFQRIITVDDIIIISNNRFGAVSINIVSIFMISYLLFDSIMLESPHTFKMQIVFIIATTVLSTFGFYLMFTHCLKICKASHFREKFHRLEQELVHNIKTEQILKQMAFSDNLTGCFTRTYAMDFLKSLVNTKEVNFCVAYIDMDGLKKINDTYGHSEGDKYIRSISHIIFNNIRKNDVFARMGGDEFIVILPGSGYKDIKTVVFKRISDDINEFNKTGSLPYKLEISYGIIDVNKNTQYSVEEIIRLADSKMYVQKRSKKAK